ncbi:Uncharacterized protein FKW44_004608, partial [Caligus rogercresseyi]
AYSRTQFTLLRIHLSTIEDVPKSKEVTLRQTASVLSEGNGQGFQNAIVKTITVVNQ